MNFEVRIFGEVRTKFKTTPKQDRFSANCGEGGIEFIGVFVSPGNDATPALEVAIIRHELAKF